MIRAISVDYLMIRPMIHRMIRPMIRRMIRPMIRRNRQRFHRLLMVVDIRLILALCVTPVVVYYSR
jgi:hypothetical protein